MGRLKNLKRDINSELSGHLPALWRFSLSLSGRPDVADDLVQATCVRAIERKDQLRDEGSAIPWLLTICRSIWLNELRAQAVRKTGGLDTATPSELTDKSLDAEMNIFAAEVYSKVMELPEAQRVAVELVYVQQFTYSEAAEILAVPIGTVMSRLATARGALAALKDEGMFVRASDL